MIYMHSKQMFICKRTVIIVDMRLTEFVKYVIIYKAATKFWKETAEENKL